MTLLELPRTIRDDSSLDRHRHGDLLGASIFDLAARRLSAERKPIPCGWAFLGVGVVSAGIWWGLISLVLLAFG